jgi:5-formyltetrahydrofolate cyclo-ligase
MNAATWRRETRARLLEARANFSAHAHQTASLAIERSLEDYLRQLTPRTISTYWPFKGEVDLRGLSERLRLLGWQTALPVVVGPKLPLVFRLWTAASEMETGTYQIPVPQTGEPVHPDVVMTPLVGFDAKNYRLGYGAAYFDITLSTMSPRPLSIGVGFELSRIETIHPLPTDIPMDIIVTESGIQKL